jgi:predicted DCC family thiol-disulfide oxidoreductase YuxK
MKSSMKTPKTQIFYNGSCTVCAPEVRMYEKLVAQEKGVKDNPIEFVDISVSAPEEFLQEDMLKRLHAKLPNGDVISGVPAFITLWKQVPGFKGLAFIINLPFIRTLAIKVYDNILAPTLYKRYIRSIKNRKLSGT